jgi:hypothetical protein
MSFWPGSNQKSEMNTFMESLNTSVTNVFNEQITNNSIRCEMLNNQNIRIGPTGSVILKKGNFNILQKANVANCNLDSLTSNDTNNEISTKIKAAIENKMDQQLKAVSGFATLSFNNQESKSKFQSIMKTAISSSINNISISSCAVSVSIVDSQTVEINGKVEMEEGDLNISQEAIINSSAKCITENILKNVNISEIDSLLKSSQTSSLYAESRGFFESLGSLFGDLKYVLIAVAVLCILGGMVFAYMKMKKNDPIKSPMTPQFSPQMYPQQMYR